MLEWSAMERIGIAASKISKGNGFVYNLSVIAISFLFSLLIFVIAGSIVVLALGMIAYIDSEVMNFGFKANKVPVLTVCMVTLTVLISIFNLLAIAKNIKISQK